MIEQTSSLSAALYGKTTPQGNNAAEEVCDSLYAVSASLTCSIDFVHTHTFFRHV